jgi:sec-independent protein translocase protein TatA
MGDLFTPGHIILVVIVALLLFGPKKLPELGRAFGKTLREFKDGVKNVVNDDDPPAPQASASRPKPLPVREEPEEHVINQHANDQQEHKQS